MDKKLWKVCFLPMIVFFFIFIACVCWLFVYGQISSEKIANCVEFFAMLCVLINVCSISNNCI